ncbi:MAG: terminase family protein [bacterium]|nr:terminase family protein [bacterium]
MLLKGNQIGGTLAAAIELTFHLTGQYPPWWEGKRFKRPIEAKASGQTAKTTRDIIQRTLFGPADMRGTGTIPKSSILRTTPKHGLADAYDTASISHVTGGVSALELKSYDQGVKAYYGTKDHVQWLDEEGPIESSDGSFKDIYLQCLMRTIATNGIVMVTMTPLQGRTPFINDFLLGCVNRAELEYK